MDQPERWVFNRLAEAYRSRPGYPEPLIDRLVELARGGPVADLGAGTGLVAILLAARGLDVVAVEPAARMLQVLGELATARGIPITEADAVEPAALTPLAPRGVASPGGIPNVESDALGREQESPARSVQPGSLVRVNRTAEDTGMMAGFPLVVLADAAHWVDPERAGQEIHRLLAPKGTLAVVEPRFSDTPFMRAVAEELRRLNPRARTVHGRGEAQLFALATGGEVHEERFSSEVTLSPAQLEGVVRSISYAGPAIGPEGLSELIARLSEHARRLGGARWARDVFLRWSACA